MWPEALDYLVGPESTSPLKLKKEKVDTADFTKNQIELAKTAFLAFLDWEKAMTPEYLDIEDLKGIFMSGGGMTKEKFVKKEVLDYRLKDKIIDFVDVGYSGEEGVRETVIKIQDKIEDLRYVQEKKLFQNFMGHISKDDGLATYGEKEVRKALLMGAVNILLLSEDLNKVRIFMKCKKCGFEDQKTVLSRDVQEGSREIRTGECPDCKSNLFQVVDNLDLIENFGNLARDQGTKLEILSSETEGGFSLFQTFGGIAAILRFKISNF